MKANREWLSISDMMAGLMMVFLFIAIVFMQNVNKQKQDMLDIAQAYKNTKLKLNYALHNEFDKDLKVWGAEILTDNTIRFKNPEVLFDRGKSRIKEKYKRILDDFFPRYISILTLKDFKDDIVEVRVEGHTSSLYRINSSVASSYIYNAKLSQSRAFSVLDYVFSLDVSSQYQEWLITVLRANGLAFAKRIYENKRENFDGSRRVEFRVLTNTEDKIEKILGN